MIYYFSGTGNSKWVAEQLAAQLGDHVLSIADLLRAENAEAAIAESAAGAVRLGIVAPIYAWGMPLIVMDFARKLAAALPAAGRTAPDGSPAPKAVFHFAVATCGEDTGRALTRLSRVFPLNSSYSIVMPNNCVTLMDVDTPEAARQAVDAARLRLPRIAEEIGAERPVTEVHEGSAAAFKTACINPLFSRFAMSPKNFRADENCTGCGLCAKVCPLGTIHLENGRPLWSGRCQMCQACINRCPQKAIQYGSATENRGRYCFKGE